MPRLFCVVLQQEASTIRPGFPVRLTLLPKKEYFAVDRTLRRLLKEVVMLQELFECVQLCEKLEIFLIFGVFGLFSSTGIVQVPRTQQWMFGAGLFVRGEVSSAVHLQQ